MAVSLKRLDGQVRVIRGHERIGLVTTRKAAERGDYPHYVSERSLYMQAVLHPVKSALAALWRMRRP